MQVCIETLCRDRDTMQVCRDTTHGSRRGKVKGWHLSGMESVGANLSLAPSKRLGTLEEQMVRES